jgi:hypothetical protein
VTNPADSWTRAVPWPTFLRAGMEHYDLWRGIYDRVVLPGWAIEEFMRSPARKLMVIAADWCGDAANTVPVLARLADLIPGMELRILPRDDHPEVMNAYLTNGTRSIPIAIALDESMGILGHWGPRPTALQEWVIAHKKLMPSPQRYAYARRWYAKDKGETTLRELLAAITGTGAPAS